MKIIRNYTLILLTIIVLSASGAFAQTERDKGLELYKQGKYPEAIRVLEQAAKQKAFKKDSDVWNYLGLAYLNQDETKNGRKALEKAVKYAPQNSIFRSNLAYAYWQERKKNKAQSAIQKAIQLDPKNATAYFIRGKISLSEDNSRLAIADAERAISIEPSFTAAYVLQADGLLLFFGDSWVSTNKPRENLNLLEKAAASLNQCLVLCPKEDSIKSVEESLETVNAFSDYFKKSKENDDEPEVNPNRTPLKLISKPRPSYTDEARRNNQQGSVELAVLFGPGGKVNSVLVLKGLPYGLTEKAVIAAKSITFEPVTENGKPIPVVKRVTMNFSIY